MPAKSYQQKRYIWYHIVKIANSTPLPLLFLPQKKTLLFFCIFFPLPPKNPLDLAVPLPDACKYGLPPTPAPPLPPRLNHPVDGLGAGPAAGADTGGVLSGRCTGTGLE